MSLRRSFPLALLAAAVLSMGQAGTGAQVTLNPVAESDTVAAGTTVRLGLQVKVGEGLHVQSNKPPDPSSIPAGLMFDPAPGVTVTGVAFPPSIAFPIPGFDQPLQVFEGDFVVGALVAVSKDAKPGALPLSARFRYQACNDTTCFFPKTLTTAWALTVVPAGQRVTPPHPDVLKSVDWARAEAPSSSSPAAALAQTAPVAVVSNDDLLKQFDRFKIVGTGAYMQAGPFIEFIKNAEAGVASKGLLEDRGPIAIVALVFLGGLALNLTPCVLPMIPINLAIIGAGARGGSKRSRGFALGLAYGAAMAAVYGVLGLVVILTAGTFGTINASPWFNIGIALLFVFLGLAMFDVVSLDFSSFSSRIRFDGKSRGTFMLAFGMGAVAALLAGACVAPVVVQVVVFASNMYAGGTSIALALPFVLGLGMALPWPIAGAGMAALPKPGAWMVRVKQVMGVFILASAAYYAYTSYEIFASRSVDPASVQASVDAQLKAGWHASLADGLAEAQRDQKLVLVDFWATWCKNCLLMDTTTLQDAGVKAALSNYVRIKFQAEDPDASPAKELLKRIRAAGLPAYVILRPPPL